MRVENNVSRTRVIQMSCRVNNKNSFFGMFENMSKFEGNI